MLSKLILSQIIIYSLILNAQTQILPVFHEVASGFDDPVVITNANDESNRLFICEQKGVIKIINNIPTGNVLPTPFLDIQSRVDFGGERGLLGLAFHLSYPDSPYFYVDYIFDPPVGLDRTRVSRFTVSSFPDTAQINSELIILEVDQPAGNHNGGDIHFGKDGYLYIALGDGGGQFDPAGHGQNLMTALGSILRINIDIDSFPADPDKYYSIPPDNPFVANPNALDEIWSFGFRNPFRFSFDELTGDLFIGDVGQSDWEEIDFQLSTSIGGENYGWSCKEGTEVQNFNLCIPGPLTDPIFEYSHTNGCSVTGGYVYRGEAFPDFYGQYFLIDYCSGMMWILNPADSTTQSFDMSQYGNIATFGQSESNELYASNIRSGDDKVYRVIDDNYCQDTLVVNTIDRNIYLANSGILSSAAVPVGDTVLFVALDSISFLENFEVPLTGVLEVELEACFDYIISRG